MAMISLITARSVNGVIGTSGSIPWLIPDDLARFEKLTSGKMVIMGRKTWDSLRNRPLKNRNNVIITNNRFSRPKGATCVFDIEHLISELKRIDEEVFIIGGASIYEQFLPYAEKLYITEVLSFVEGDAFFPKFDQDEWVEISREEISGNPCYIFRELVRSLDSAYHAMKCSV